MANLLERASVVLTPTAYNNGEALCIKPDDASGDFTFSRNSAATRVNAQGLVENVQILSGNLVQNGDFSEEGVQEVSNGSFSQEGAEQITNGSFSTDTDWLLFQATISNGVANFATIDGSFAGIRQNSVFTIGKTYLISLEVSNLIGTAEVNTNGGTSIGLDITSNGTKSFYMVAENTDIEIKRKFGITNVSATIDNVSVREVGQDWEIEDTWTIGDGVANGNGATGSTSELKQYNVNTIGKTYKATFEVLNYVSGTVGFWKGSGVSVIDRSADGIYTEYFTATSAEIRFRPNNFNGSIDNVSVKEYLGQEVVPDSGCGSWLWEPQTTQLVTYSEDFSQYSNVGTITLTGGLSSPDGGNNAYKVEGVIGSTVLYLPSVLTINSTRSIYARTVSGTGTAQLLSHTSNTNNLFNITEDWQRFDVNLSGGAGVSTFYGIDFRGSGTLSEIILWGANATNDQDYATSYIPSNGSTVTRNQDVCNNGATGTGLINSTEGVLYAEIAALADDGTSRRITLLESLYDKVSLVLSPTSNSIQGLVLSEGSVQFNQTFSISNTLDFNKIAFKYKTNDFAIWVNGVEVATDTSGNTPIGLSELSFADGDNTSNKFFGKTKALAVWKEALSDAELTELTTI